MACALDLCPKTASPSQSDTDFDGIGDVCDNCAQTKNVNQTDLDHDGQGDLCDLNDGVIYITPGAMGDDEITWQDENGYDEWNLYKGSIPVLRSTGVYTQLPGSNFLAAKVCGLTDNWYIDTADQVINKAAFFLVTGMAGGAESSLGNDTRSAVRVNTNPCQ
jgi:hypothetical protein